MSLIDQTYFNGTIAIPAIKYEPIQGIIDRYETQLIIDLFGYELAKLVKDYDPLTSEQRIIDIVQGKEFTTRGGYLQKWNGLINLQKESVIAYWVFYKWAYERETIPTRSAAIKPTPENSENASFESKAFAAYNHMLDFYGYRGQCDYAPSCFNFMYANQDLYPEWKFQEKRPINLLGI